MKKQFAMIFMAIFLIQTNIFGLSLELNASYDYFRGMPDGSWNGNTGGFLSANLGANFDDCTGVQVGGSYGLYNWDGRENLVFKNPKTLEQQAFITAGFFSSFWEFNAGLVYDRLFTKHFGIYDLSPNVDQLRFQGGYQFCSEELGIWGTAHLTTAHKSALGVPIAFRAIDQMNFFWSHYFENSAKTMVWLGAPYRNSLMFHSKTAGTVTAGFLVRVPLAERLFIDGYGAYMGARKSSGIKQSRNYDANICIGITYLFGGECLSYDSIYMPVANNSNFMVDTNINQ